MSDKKDFKYIRQVKQIGNSAYDRMHILYGLTEECQPEQLLGSGSYGRVYGGTLKKRSILKVYKRIFQNKAEMDALVQKSIILLHNPSAHTVNIYKVKDKDGRVYIIQQKCNHTLKQQIQSSLSPIKSFDEIKKYVDQIIRGVVHYHSIGIIVGAINFDEIFVLNQNNFKILKVSLSTRSVYKPEIINKSFSEINDKDLHLDMKMLAKVIIKLIWKQQFDQTKQTFQPLTKIQIDQDHMMILIDLINQCLQGKINSMQLHDSYKKKNIYRIKPQQALKQAQPVAQQRQETQFEKQINTYASNFIDSVFEKNSQAKQENTNKLINVVKNKQAVDEFLNILEEIIDKDQ